MGANKGEGDEGVLGAEERCAGEACCRPAGEEGVLVVDECGRGGERERGGGDERERETDKVAFV